MVEGDIRATKERSFARLCRNDLSCLDRDRLSLGAWIQASFLIRPIYGFVSQKYR